MPTFVDLFGLYHHLPPAMGHIVGWIVDALPDISNLILVLVGVIMSLPKLAERIEDYAVARYFLSIGCIFIGVCGFVVGVNQRRQANSDMSTLIRNTNTLVTNTNVTVGNTNMIVLMVPQVAALQGKVAEIDAKLTAARTKNNPKLVSDLETEATKARAQADNASDNLLLSVAVQTYAEMKAWSDKWSSDDNALGQK
jgi:hypothetical protein